MIQPARGRPPATVTAAVVLYVVKFGVAPAAIGLWPTGLRTTSPSLLRWDAAGVIAAVIVNGLFLALSYGLWRGSNGSRAVVLLLAVASLIIGLAQFPRFPSWWVLLWVPQMALVAALAVLLLLPAASRAWFASTKPARDSTPNPEPDAKVSTQIPR